uniref:ShKT domain-containing protein n=1 Tax=Panagrolaimus superbus TaxID=310955 RepID=A0A914YW52_9BILA
MECENEKDDRGEFLCTEWARSGLCEAHRATMFLFCRKTCLCTGPPKDDDSSESDDATRRRRRRRRSAAALKSFKSHFKNYKIISA